VTSDETDRFYVDFGRRVRAAREQQGLTQQALADTLGLTRSSVANIEAGRQRALLHMTAAVSAATGVPAADLLPDKAALTAPPSLRRDLERLSDTNREAVEMLLRRTSDTAKAAG
jgi:transcriptional regulator with XRE-family HTH domain